MFPWRSFTVLVIVFFIPALLFGCEREEARPEKTHGVVNDTFIAARTGERYIEVYDGENWSDLLIKGVNIGTSLPGRWYTEFPADRELYRTWLEQIAEMNANTVRIYTLLDPAFYSVFAEYNSDQDNESLWLIQEIWPHDEVPDLNLHDEDYRETYIKEINLVIDALHGKADIPARPYRAYGNYSVDVSPYLLGILVGRELEPDEVQSTDEANPGLDSYAGDFVQAAPGKSSPTEVWLAEMCDRVQDYSHSEYGWQYPVGFVSWPTLDPLDHKTEYEEDGTPGYNVRETVDPNIFESGPKSEAGFFGAYHIYPNYPDFMNNEPAFAEYEDDQGIFRYKGYLKKFMDIHPSYPALVAEFGISTSLNTAHLSPDGLHHGGLSENEQGEMTVRMMRSIVDEDYAGGIIFEWSDEWAKKTWNTVPFMIPWERQVLWQNAMCPEQNYGIMAVEPRKRSKDELFHPWLEIDEQTVFEPAKNQPDTFGKIKALEIGADEAFLYLAIELDFRNPDLQNNPPWGEIGLAVGIDVGFREAGDFIIPLSGLPELPTGIEFLLHIASADKADLLAVPSYNRGKLAFEPRPTSESNFTRIETLVNRRRVTADGRVFEALYSDESSLNYGIFNPGDDRYNSIAHWHIEEEDSRIIVRLPWMLLNVSDPSDHKLLSDPGEYADHPARDELSYEATGGFKFYAATYSKQERAASLDDHPPVIDFEPRAKNKFAKDVSLYLWSGWEEPQHQFRLKESYDTIAGYFGDLD